MKVNMIKQVIGTMAVATVITFGAEAVNQNVDASTKVVKQLPKAYRHTWYSVGHSKQSGETVGFKAKVKVTKTNYSFKVDGYYEGVVVSSTHAGYKKYTAQKTKNGSYVLSLFKKEHGKWVAKDSDILKLTTEKFAGKKYKVLKEGTGKDAIYFFQSVKLAKQSQYNLAKNVN